MIKTVAWQIKSVDGSWGPPTTREKIARLLQKEGYEVRELCDIEEVKRVLEDIATHADAYGLRVRKALNDIS